MSIRDHSTFTAHH